MIRVAQIGAGGWGKNHLRVLSNMGALSAVCDTDPARAKTYGQRYQINHYTSLSELLESEPFDVAVVATPTSTHADIAKTLISHRKHVLIEKPFTYEPSQGEELEKLAKRARVQLSCGYIERFNPVIKAMRDIVRSRRYGQLMQLEFHRENHLPVHIKDVGIIYDTAVHDIDTANWLFDEMPQVVFARAGQVTHIHEDFATIMLGYSNNRTATITCNWLSPERVRMFRAAFTEAVVTGDFIAQKVTADGESISTDTGEPLAAELESFLGAAAKNQTPLVTPHQAVCVSQIAKAALLSSRRGVPIYLDMR